MNKEYIKYEDEVKRLKQIKEYKKLKRELEPNFFQRVLDFFGWLKK